MGRTALVMGASGLVGHELVTQLLAAPAYGTVRVWVRRPLPLSHPKLVQQVVSFDNLDQEQNCLGVDDLFCALGTTMKKAGSPEAFRKVDYEYPLAAARLALAGGVRQFLLVSSAGANAASSVFYSRVKGEVEAAVAAVGLPGFQVFRPSLLLGERQESRPGERLAAAVSRALGFLFVGPLRRYRPISGADVARAMIVAAGRAPSVTTIYESDEIASLARST